MIHQKPAGRAARRAGVNAGLGAGVKSAVRGVDWQVLGAMTNRRRCVVCRLWYRPASSAVKDQCVCSAACRRERRLKLAKLRRGADLKRFRSEEKRRQQKSRARRRQESSALKAPAEPKAEPKGEDVTAGHAADSSWNSAAAEPKAEPKGEDVTAGHAPASTHNLLKSLAKIQKLWDKQMRLSRASLDRELERMGRKFRQMVSEAWAGGGT